MPSSSDRSPRQGTTTHPQEEDLSGESLEALMNEAKALDAFFQSSPHVASRRRALERLLGDCLEMPSSNSARRLEHRPEAREQKLIRIFTKY
jgi:hypothetical protein